ncbi:hypothetical protein HOA59_01750 [archaeon]|jgi:hypothetical protein|nr:hypothetical protein [archaeon]MBT6824140.1 hypothetical protein [archaeon]MBT7107016.1 hypothetical protein [archaeon]MBT7297628.1 hypothetical protein [archaeon]
MNKPIKKYKSGSIECSIWNNEKELDGKKVEFKTLSLKRSWKDGDVWRDQQISFRRNDIIRAILVLEKAQEDLLLDNKGGDEL